MKVVNETILIVEDNVGLNELLSEKVNDCGYETYSVYSAVQAFEWLEGNSAFLILLDFSLPDLNGKEFIEWLNSENIPLPPFIVATGQGDERIAVQMMKLGARDYVVKDSNFLELIPLSINKVFTEILNEQKLKFIENELAESNKFNKQIIKSAQEGIIVYDLDMKYQVWNPFMEKITGIQATKVLGKKALDVFPFLKETGMTENLKRALKGDKASEIEFYFSIPETGKSGWVSDIVAPLRNAENHIIGAIAAVHDITERKKSELALRKSEELYRNLVERLPDGVYKSTHEGKFVEVNPAMVKMLGYANKEELMAIDIKTDLYFDVADRESLIQNEFNQELDAYLLKKKDGSAIWVEDNGWYNTDENGNVITHEGVLRDISERKKSEEALLESEAKYRELVENSPDAIVIYIDGVVRFVNKTGIQLIGAKSEKELIGKPVMKFVHPDSREIVMERVKTIQTPGKVLDSQEEKFLRLDGSSIEVEVKAMSLMMENKLAVQLIVRDITERKKIQDELIERKNLFRKLLSTSTELIDSSSNTIDYERITEIARELSGAKYACFNIFDENGRDFETVAFSGLTGFQQKALDLFGFEIINKKWAYDPIREAKIKDNVITEFDSLETFAHNILPKYVYNRIKKAYNFGKIAVVKITKNNKNVGDFTLLMREGVDIKNPEILELFAYQVGLFIERQLSEEKLRNNEEKFRILFAENPQPMFVYDVETLEILEVNQTALNFYGYSKKDFLSMSVQKLHALEELPIFLKTIEQTRAGINTDGISQHIKKNGEKVTVEIFTVPATLIGANARHVLVVDITERKLSEEALTQKMDELMRFQHLTVGREHTMIELKKEINRLLVRNGEMEKYKIVE